MADEENLNAPEPGDDSESERPLRESQEEESGTQKFTPDDQMEKMQAPDEWPDPPDEDD